MAHIDVRGPLPTLIQGNKTARIDKDFMLSAGNMFFLDFRNERSISVDQAIQVAEQLEWERSLDRR